jgi:catechol 2,3-dioxygenase
LPVIGHVHLKVSNLDRSEEFYRDALGLEVTERVGASFVVMSFGASHHHLALQGHPDAPPADPEALGLYHFAIEVDNEEDLRAAVDRLEAAEIEFAAVDHGISKSVYFSDPDGHGVEVYFDTRELRHRPEWEGIAAPLDVDELPRE